MDTHLKDLEAEDVQHADHGRSCHLDARQGGVHATDQVVEQPRVDSLGDGVTSVRRLLDVLRHIVGRLAATLLARVDDTEENGVLECERLDVEHGGGELQYCEAMG